MPVYTFSKEHMTNILSHAAGLDIEVLDLQLSGSSYTATLASAFDAGQYEHLQSASDLLLVE